MGVGYLLFGFIGVCWINDVRSRKIPNFVNLAGTAAGLLYHLITGGWLGLIFSFAGMVCGFAVLFLLYVCKAVGAGDVKCFAAIGAMTGVFGALNATVYSILYAGLIGIVWFTYKRMWVPLLYELWSRMFPILCLGDRRVHMPDAENLGRLHRFPFMLAALPGVLTAFFYPYG